MNGQVLADVLCARLRCRRLFTKKIINSLLVANLRRQIKNFFDKIESGD